MLCDVASASGGVASAYIIAQIAGVNPVHHIAVLQGIAGTAVVGEPSVDLAHPSGLIAYIKLIEIMLRLEALITFFYSKHTAGCRCSRPGAG